MSTNRLVFVGHIAGFGTRLGARIVIGVWADSPFGSFSDVMLETTDGARVLLAPRPDVAHFVASTYQFDQVRVAPVQARLTRDELIVSATDLQAVVRIGGPAAIDRLLRLVPARLASAPRWLQLIEPIAARVLPGVHTVGTAGNRRREYYGVRRSRLITAVDGRLNGRDLGGVAPLHPPVRFGFASAPKNPQIVAVTTLIDSPSE